MALADFATYQAEVASPWQRLRASKSALTTVAGRLYSLWTTATHAGTAPTTAVAPTRTTAGAIRDWSGTGDLINSGGTQRIVRATGYAGQPGRLILIDRLSHQGGLSGVVTTAQTTNLPTAALTRYTSGVGVFAGLEITTQIGTTATTVTASYTDETATGGNTTQATVFGGTAFREAGRMIVLPLAAGDVGVQAVASVTVLATTGTAGAFGVTLFKPLCQIPVMQQGPFVWDPLLDNGGHCPDIVSDACLSWLFLPYTTSTGGFEIELSVSED